jgi:signal transduction histidine kinase
MKNMQSVQSNFIPSGLASDFKPFSYLKGLGTALISSRLFTAKKQVSQLQQQVSKTEHEIARLKWELVQKNEQVKNITYHQSHTVRRPLANILGIIELMNNNKNNQDNTELLEMISLLKISADDLDKAIKHNSAL